MSTARTILAAAALVAAAGAPSPASAGAADDAALRPLPVAGVDFHSNHVSKLIFLNPCRGGCVIEPGPNDARYDTSRIVSTTAYISEFSHDDEVWDAVVQCVKEVYAPYDVQITEVDPGEEVFHHEAIVAGTWQEIDWDYAIGGVAPSQCYPNNNVISFTFANVFRANALAICAVVAQETAHSFGLEHAYDCSDPMTYLPACGRQFFRDRTSACGEYAPLEQCVCGGAAQNSHRWLRTVLGENPVPVPGPELSLTAPSPDSAVESGFRVVATALDMRGVDRVELRINGTLYDTEPGHAHDRAGDPYRLDPPADLADGVLDLEVTAYNDIGAGTTHAITATKGAPCGTPDDCNPGQQCANGRCFWPPPEGQLGDPCTADAECVSGLCPMEGERGHCSETCFPVADSTCPQGFTCREVSLNEGVCWPAGGDGGGCGCAAGAPPPDTGTGVAVLGGLCAFCLLLWRRRRA
jgi:hypothetical protein